MAPKKKGPHWEEQARLLEQGIWRSTSSITRRKTRPDKQTRAKEKARREQEAQNPRPTPPEPPRPKRGDTAASTPSQAVVLKEAPEQVASPAHTSSSDMEVEVRSSAASSSARPSLRLVEARPLGGPEQAQAKPDPAAAAPADLPEGDTPWDRRVKKKQARGKSPAPDAASSASKAEVQSAASTAGQDSGAMAVDQEGPEPASSRRAEVQLKPAVLPGLEDCLERAKMPHHPRVCQELRTAWSSDNSIAAVAFSEPNRGRPKDASHWLPKTGLLLLREPWQPHHVLPTAKAAEWLAKGMGRIVYLLGTDHPFLPAQQGLVLKLTGNPEWHGEEVALSQAYPTVTSPIYSSGRLPVAMLYGNMEHPKVSVETLPYVVQRQAQLADPWVATLDAAHRRHFLHYYGAMLSWLSYQGVVLRDVGLTNWFVTMEPHPTFGLHVCVCCDLASWGQTKFNQPASLKNFSSIVGLVQRHCAEEVPTFEANLKQKQGQAFHLFRRAAGPWRTVLDDQCQPQP